MYHNFSTNAALRDSGRVARLGELEAFILHLETQNPDQNTALATLDIELTTTQLLEI